MRLKDLIDQYRWLDVRGFILMYYPSEEKSIVDGYREVYKTLEELEPVQTDMRICIEHFVDDDGYEFEDVYGRDSKKNKELEASWPKEPPDSYSTDSIWLEEEASWGLDFKDWGEWLGMEIDLKTLEYYNGPNILALCLYEMTFYGYDRESIRAVKDVVDERVDEYNADKNLGTKFESFDDVMDGV